MLGFPVEGRATRSATWSGAHRFSHIPVLDKVLFANTLFLRLATVLYLLEQRARSSEYGFGSLKLVHSEAALDQTARLRQKAHTCLHIVHHRDVAVRIAAIDEWEFDGGATVTAVEDDEQCAVGRQSGYERFVELVAVDLAVLLEVDGNDGVVEARPAL